MWADVPVWALLPEDFVGYGRDPERLFGKLQRVGRWGASGPELGREARALIEVLARDAGAGTGLPLALPRVVELRRSQDGSSKLMLELGDGARVEAVHMPRALRRRDRVTVCLSTQVGCAMGCTFCATAAMKLVRNLTAGEIVAQLLAVLRGVPSSPPASAESLSVVFMGMGEPLHNVAAVTRAVRVMCHPAGLGLAPSRVTVSTSGVVPGIDALAAADPRPLLALSVNATTDAQRARLMPLTRAWGLGALREALLRWPRRPHEKITLEYVLLAGENDSDEDAARLADFARGSRHVLNVIPFNEYPGAAFREPSEDRLQRFVRSLQEKGCLVTVRRSRGRDIQAACGELATITSPARRGRATQGSSGAS